MKWFKTLTTIEVVLLVPLFIGISAYFSTVGISRLVAMPLAIVVLVVVAIDVAKFVGVGLIAVGRSSALRWLMLPVIIVATFATSFSFYAALVYSHTESESYKREQTINEADVKFGVIKNQIARYEQLLEDVERGIAALERVRAGSLRQEQYRQRQLEMLMDRKNRYLVQIDSLEKALVLTDVTSKSKENLYFLNRISPNFYFALLTIVFDPLAILLYATFIRMFYKENENRSGRRLPARQKERKSNQNTTKNRRGFEDVLDEFVDRTVKNSPEVHVRKIKPAL